jgi:hypothetical protein
LYAGLYADGAKTGLKPSLLDIVGRINALARSVRHMDEFCAAGTGPEGARTGKELHRLHRGDDKSIVMPGLDPGIHVLVSAAAGGSKKRKRGCPDQVRA